MSAVSPCAISAAVPWGGGCADDPIVQSCLPSHAPDTPVPGVAPSCSASSGATIRRPPHLGAVPASLFRLRIPPIDADMPRPTLEPPAGAVGGLPAEKPGAPPCDAPLASLALSGASASESRAGLTGCIALPAAPYRVHAGRRALGIWSEPTAADDPARSAKLLLALLASDVQADCP